MSEIWKNYQICKFFAPDSEANSFVIKGKEIRQVYISGTNDGYLHDI